MCSIYTMRFIKGINVQWFIAATWKYFKTQRLNLELGIKFWTNTFRKIPFVLSSKFQESTFFLFMLMFLNQLKLKNLKIPKDTFSGLLMIELWSHLCFKFHIRESISWNKFYISTEEILIKKNILMIGIGNLVKYWQKNRINLWSFSLSLKGTNTNTLSINQSKLLLKIQISTLILLPTTFKKKE